MTVPGVRNGVVSGRSALARVEPGAPALRGRKRSSSSRLPGREGLGVGAAEALGGLRACCLDDAIEIFHHVAIPEADHRPTLSIR